MLRALVFLLVNGLLVIFGIVGERPFDGLRVPGLTLFGFETF